jgi:reductive dehalogenase
MAGVKTPDKYGVSKWNGTPEENGRMVRTLMRFFGATKIRYLDINERTKKLFHTHTIDNVVVKHNRELVWEDVEWGYQTLEKDVVPNRFKHMIVFTWPEPWHSLQRPRGALWRLISSWNGCFRGDIIQPPMQKFLKGIGYQGLAGSAMMGLGNYTGWGVLAGHGEMGRQTDLLAVDEFAGSSRVILTDLPLPVDNPIDAGIARFCLSCTKCADACPMDAIEKQKEPKWEIYQSDDPNRKPELFNNPGLKAYHFDNARCAKHSSLYGNLCGTCQIECVFAKRMDSSVHDLVLGVVAQTSALNTFFFNMDKAFGYGALPAEKYPDFWDLEEKMPIQGYGYDAGAV